MNTIKYIFYISILTIGYNTYGMEISFPSHSSNPKNYQDAKNNLIEKHAEELQELNYKLLFELHYATNEETRDNVAMDASKSIVNLKEQQKQAIKQLKLESFAQSNK